MAFHAIRGTFFKITGYITKEPMPIYIISTYISSYVSIQYMFICLFTPHIYKSYFPKNNSNEIKSRWHPAQVTIVLRPLVPAICHENLSLYTYKYNNNNNAINNTIIMRLSFDMAFGTGDVKNKKKNKKTDGHLSK